MVHKIRGYRNMQIMHMIEFIHDMELMDGLDEKNQEGKTGQDN
jgi:hypothetical protein